MVPEALLIASAWALAAAGAAEPAAPLTLGEPAELLKLPRSALSPAAPGGPFVRVSPDGTRFLYLRYAGKDADVIPYVGSVSPKSDSPVPWDGHGIPSLYCQLGLSGTVWRADSQRVLFLQPRFLDTGPPVEHCERTLSPWAMCWDLNNPQCQRCKVPSLSDGVACTSLSYSPDGKRLWAAWSDLAEGKRGGLTGWDSDRDRGATFYETKDASIFHVAPSPDGRHLAWVEQARGQTPRDRRLEVVLFDPAGGKVLRRIALAPEVLGWSQASPPIWTGDSAAVCYGDVGSMDRIARRVVYLWKLDARSPVEVARDAVAIGAAGDGLVLNRGPSCVPMAQHVSSYAPVADPRPGRDEVALYSIGSARLTTLLPDACAQHVAGGRLIYAVLNGRDILILSAALKPAAKGSPGNRASPAPARVPPNKPPGAP